MAKIVKVIFILLLGCFSQVLASEQKVLRVPLHGSTIVFDTAKLQDISSLWVSRQINCQLVRMHGGVPTLDAAKSIHYLSPVLLDVELKRNIMFSDGSELTASDIIATFQYLRNNSVLQKNLFDWIKSIKQKNKYEVIFELRQPVPQLLTVLSAPYYAIFKKDFILKADKNKSIWNKPISCGGYKVVQNNNKIVKLRSNNKKGLPIDFHLLPNSQLPASELKKYDIVAIEVVGRSKEMNNFSIVKIFDPFQYYFALNTQIAPWNKREARCAFFARLNAKIPAKVYGNDVKPADDFLPSGTLGYVGHKHYMQDIVNKFKNYHLPNVKSMCVSFVATSVPKSYRPAYLKMIKKVYPHTSSKLIKNCANINFVLNKQKCAGTFLAAKSHIHDGYEYFESLVGRGSAVIGHKYRKLSNEIDNSQNVDQPSVRAESYHSIITRIHKLCLIYPLFTMPYDKIFIKNNIISPGIGKTEINNYFLGNVTFKSK